MAKTEKRKLGDTGEEVASKYLTNKGYKVVERNYLRPWGEVDIVAEKANKVHFVEVKTVSRDTSVYEGSRVTPTQRVGEPTKASAQDYYRPEENVHPAKLKRLHRAIQTYLLDHKVPGAKEWQIDVMCVYLDLSTHKAHVEVIENVIL